MKRNIYFILLVLLTFISACEGPSGPIGPQGPKGNDGLDGVDGEEAFTFEFEGIDFTASNGYRVVLPYGDDFEMQFADVALTYLLWEVDEETDLEVWRALPQTVMHDEGLLVYNYDFTLSDVAVFLDTSFNPDLLEALWTDNNLFRVVVVPAQLLNGRTALDLTDYHAVAQHFGLKVEPVDEKYKSVKRPQID